MNAAVKVLLARSCLGTQPGYEGKLNLVSRSLTLRSKASFSWLFKYHSLASDRDASSVLQSPSLEIINGPLPTLRLGSI